MAKVRNCDRIMQRRVPLGEGCLVICVHSTGFWFPFLACWTPIETWITSICAPLPFPKDKWFWNYSSEWKNRKQGIHVTTEVKYSSTTWLKCSLHYAKGKSSYMCAHTRFSFPSSLLSLETQFISTSTPLPIQKESVNGRTNKGSM